MIMGGDPLYVPEDVIRNILKRLPLKSLIQFRCVSKDWNNLLKTSSFIADHLRHNHQNSYLLFECGCVCDPYGCHIFHLCLVDRQIKIRRVHNAFRIPYARIVGSTNGLLCVRFQSTTNSLLDREIQIRRVDNVLRIPDARIVGSSNGLLCVRFRTTTDSLLVCNLAVKDVRHVPKPLNRVGKDFGNAKLGFGFSAIVKDYKIVKIFSSYNLIYRAVMFSLSTGLWKDVAVGSLQGVVRFTSFDSFTTNGAIFWFGSKPGEEEGENNHHLIVSFDISREVFTLIPMPPIRFRPNYTNFTVYEDKLALLYAIGNTASYLIELWVMEEDASVERWIWTKKYRSKSYPCMLNPMTIWRNNEIVCRVDYDMSSDAGRANTVKGKIALINLNTNEFNVFALRGLGYCYGVVNYTESLVPVNDVPNEEPRT